MNDLAKNLMLWVVVAVVLMVVFQSFSPKIGGGQEVVYSPVRARRAGRPRQEGRHRRRRRTHDQVRAQGRQHRHHHRPRRDEDLVNDLINHKVEITQAPPASGIVVLGAS